MPIEKAFKLQPEGKGRTRVPAAWAVLSGRAGFKLGEARLVIGAGLVAYAVGCTVRGEPVLIFGFDDWRWGG